MAVVQYTFTHKQYIEHNRHKTIHRTTQFTNQEECRSCPVFARYTLAFALQLRKKHGEIPVRVAGECQLAKNIQESKLLKIGILLRVTLQECADAGWNFRNSVKNCTRYETENNSFILVAQIGSPPRPPTSIGRYPVQQHQQNNDDFRYVQVTVVFGRDSHEHGLDRRLRTSFGKAPRYGRNWRGESLYWLASIFWSNTTVPCL